MFLMMDHFGGVNTLLSTLAYGGVAICVEQRSPEAVCRAIARGRAELLPTTPTFLNMIIASGAWRHHDLSALRLITYGTEPMPEATLRRIREVFPQAALKQTYGLSELGVLHSQSPDPGSLWLRIGGKGFETRVVDGMLHIRSESSMVGYLNAPSPIDADGWMNTGDVVEEQNGLIRFVGRASEVINVGGQKVFPMEVESVLLGASNVIEATVFGVRHPLLGQAVRAIVSLAEPEAEEALAERLKDHCRARLAKYKVPLRFDVADPESHVSERAKKRRFAIGHAERQDA
jgi:long-chain acyl-CoA synthetase